MSFEISRREFILKAGLAALSLPVLSCARTNTTGANTGLQIGYSAITWGGNDEQAILDIAALGFKGIQLRSNVLAKYSTNPDELKQLLNEGNLTLAMFSSGDANINTGNDEAVIDRHIKNAEFVKALGGQYIQVTNSSRPKGVSPSLTNLKQYGQLLNEIGKRVRDLGVQVAYHNHMHQLGETPREVELILENCDTENVSFLLDIAHYHQGGGNPVEAIHKYQDRLKALHLKDVRPKAGGDPNAYTFVELGQGNVDLKGVFKALDEIKFSGWGIIELDSVPEKEKSPRQCAEISRAYLQSLGIKI